MLNRRKYNRRRQFIATLLLAVLLPMLAVKAFHFHSEGSALHHHEHTTTTHFAVASAESDCSLCHFIVPPFHVASEVVFTPYTKTTTIERNTPRVATVVVSILRAQANAPPMA